MTINEAIVQVITEAGHPLTPKEAYDRIVKGEIYRFRAQNPQSIVTGQIRRHCKDLDFPSAEPTKYFGLTEDGRFYALDRPITISPRSSWMLTDFRMCPSQRPAQVEGLMALGN